MDAVAGGDSEAEQLLFNRFSRRLIQLASGKICEVFNSKIEPEDVVQSVFKSFFVRHRRGDLEFNSWDDIWSFLACVTARKCSEKTGAFLTKKRCVNRESADSQRDEQFSRQLTNDEPTPEHVAMFNELLSQLFGSMTESQRDIIRFRMQGFTNTEIAKKLGRTERTVYRALLQLRETSQELFNLYLNE